MGTIKRRKLISILKEEGCQFFSKRGKGSHIRVKNPKTNKTSTIPNDSELEIGFAKTILNQIGLSKDLIDWV